ncbi:hypothetical protein TrST_g9172, partial [Triparma strigata]
SESVSSKSSDEGPEFVKHDKISARYNKKSKFYPAKITKVHKDGSFDLEYSDSSKKSEKNVKAKYIKARSRSESPASDSSSSNRRGRKGRSPPKSKKHDDMKASRLARFDSKDPGSNSKSKSRSRSRRGRSQSSNSSNSSRSSGSDSSPTSYDFEQGDIVKCCYYRAPHSSKYSKPQKNSKFLSAKIRRFNKDNRTYKVEFLTSTRDVVDAVPARYIKASSRSSPSPSSSSSPTRRRASSWDPLVNLANHHYDEDNRHGDRPSLHRATKNSKGDDYKKLEKLLSRSSLASYRDIFEQYDSGGNDELEFEDVVEAFDALGRRCSLQEIKTYSKDVKLSSRAMNFLDFMKCYATMFFSGESSTSSEPSSLRHKAMDHFVNDEASDLQRWAEVLGDKQLQMLEEAWEKHATPLIRADGTQSSRVGVKIRDLRATLRSLNRDISHSTLSAFLSHAGLKAGDVLSLADFAYAFHAIFADGGVDNVFSGVAKDSGPFNTFDRKSSSLSTGHVLQLNTISQTAAAIFSQTPDWEGRPDQHHMMIRKLSIGRDDGVQQALRKARDAFEDLDENDEGEIEGDSISTWLENALPSRKVTQEAKVISIVAELTGSKSSENKGKENIEDEENDGKNKKKKKPAKGKSCDKKKKSSKSEDGKSNSDDEPNSDEDNDDDEKSKNSDESSVEPSAFTLPELLTYFGYLFEATASASSPSVPTAFAELRLHNKPSDVREAGEVVREFIQRVLDKPTDVKNFRIASSSAPYASKVGTKKGGESLMTACGFSKQWVDAKNSKDSAYFFVLEGGNAKAKKTKPPAASKKSKGSKKAKESTAPASKDAFQLNLESKIEDIDAELLALDGVPSVAAAIRTIREGDPTNPLAVPVTLKQVYGCVDTVLSCVSSLLKNPKDSRLHRVRTTNPTFQRTLGRFYGSPNLMESCGFELIEGGAIFSLKRLSSAEDAAAAHSIASTAGSQTGTLANFKFPDLDEKTTAFLYRKRADLLAALDTLSSLVESDIDGGLDAPNRAQRDFEDAGRPNVAAVGKKESKKEVKKKGGKAEKSLLTSEMELFLKGRTGVQRAQLVMLKEAFDAFDHDKDGFITAADLKAFWRAKGEDNSDSRILNFIKSKDINHDGRVTYEEFAVSYSNLLQPETKAWVSLEKGSKSSKSKPSKSSKKGGTVTFSVDIDPEEVDDGASPVAAAFGALRLCTTIPQCLIAVQRVEAIVKKILETPSAKSYWRIKVNDSDFHTNVGRHYGGIALIKAFGFALEENGSVLALSEKATADKPASSSGHSRWERPPKEVIKSLRDDLKELSIHMAGLLSPEVSDINAVSSAVARLRNPKSGDAWSASLVVETAVVYMTNILASPEDPNLRVINTSNLNFQRRIAAFEGGIDLLLACGFRSDTETGALVFPTDGDLRYLKARKLELETGLKMLQRFAHHEATVKENLRRKDERSNSPTKKSKKSRSKSPKKESRRDKEEKSRRKKSKEPDDRSTTSSVTDNDVKKALIEAKLKMEKNVADIRAASNAKIREIERKNEGLTKEVQNLYTKLDKTIPRRDASTISRMKSEDKKASGKAAATFGLTTSAFKTKGAGNATKRATSPSKGKSARGKKGKAVASTTLKKHVEPGTAILQVDTMEGFEVGHRIRIGDKKNAEERWVVALGSLVLSEPLRNGHMAGANIVSLGPASGEVQKKSFERACVLHFITSDIIQNMLVLPAINQGEKILIDRKAQRKFEKRKVDKHIVSATPAFCQTVGAGDEKSTASTVASVNSVGKVIVKSENKLVTLNEGFGFSQLNMMFDSFDLQQKGYIVEDDISSSSSPYLSALCIDGGAEPSTKLELFRSFPKTEEDGKSVVFWRNFVSFFRQTALPTGGDPTSAWAKELWARGLSESDVVSVVRAFALNLSPSAESLSVEEAVSSMLELSADFNSNPDAPCTEELVHATLATVLAGKSTHVKVNQFARLYVELIKLGKGPLLWKKTAEALLKEIYLQHSAGPNDVLDEEGAAAFLHDVENNASLKPYLDCLPTEDAHVTLHSRLNELSSSPTVNFNMVRASIYELPALAPKVFLRPATTTALQQSVHEVVVVGDTMYLLMLDGTLQTWSAVLGVPTALAASTRVITHEPTPDPSGGSITTKRNETQTANFEWRQSVNLDNVDTKDSSTTPENVDAEFLAAKFAKELLSMTPRVDVLHVCPHTSSLLLNTTAGDRCIRFHESASLRRTHRVRLQLPNMPYFDHGLFDVGPGGYENGNGVTHRVSSHMGDETAGAMQKFVYLPHSSVLIGTVVGSPVLVGFCTVSGLPLARFVGHCLPKFSKNAVAVSSLVSTLNFNGHIASGGSDGDIRVWDVGSELLPAVKRRWAPARDAIMSGSGASRMRFGDIAAFEDSLVSRKSAKFNHKVNTLYADPTKLEKFSSLRNSIKNSMGEEEGPGMKVWRFGVVTAITDASVASASLELGAASENFLLRSEKPFVEVTYDDGSTQFNVPKRLIRTVQEATKRGDRGPNFDDDPVVVYLEDSGTIVPLMSTIGEKVAVWTTKTRVYDFVLSMFSHLDSAASFDAPVNGFVAILSSMLAREYNDEGDENDLNSVNALSSAVANMAIEDLEELASAFDEFETGFVDVKMFATWVSQGVLIPSTGVGWRTRLVTSSRVVQRAHLGGVSTLSYLPHSMLLVSGGFGDNVVKMWDPVAHRHRLVRPDCGPVVRWRGKSSKDAYQSLPEEWTDAGSPYNEVYGVDIVGALKALEGGLTKVVVNEFGDEIVEDLSEGVKVVPVGFRSMVVSDCVADITTVRCDGVNAKAARSIDSENREGKKESFLSDPDSYASGGAKTGFLYCLSNGDVFVVESKEGFDENFVLMERETLTVKAGVGKSDAFDEVEEAKKVFENRTKVRRIAYVAMSGSDGGTLRELKSTVVEMGCMSKASPTASLLSLGVRAVVFFSDKDDGSTSLKNDERSDRQSKNLSGMRTASAVVVSINNSSRTAVIAPESLYYPGAVGQLTVPLSRIVEGTLEVGGKVKYGVAASVAIGGEEDSVGGGAAELLCCEVIVTIGDDVLRKIVCFAVGRTTVRVKASDFDRSEGDRALISNAKVAFLQRFESSLNRFRAISPRSVNGLVRCLRGKDEVVKTALRDIQSAVIDEPAQGSGKGKAGGKEGAIKDAFQKFVVLGRSDALKVAMFEVTAALSSHGEYLWAAEESRELKVGTVIQALVQHMQVCSRGYHVLASLLLSTGGGGMGPLCESLVGLVSSGGYGSLVTWENVKSFVAAACTRIVGSSITVEQTYLIAASSLLLPTPPFRVSPEAFARSVGAIHPTLCYVGPEGLENVAMGRASVGGSSTPATLPLCLESESFAEVLGNMNPMTVSKMQLEKLQSIINEGFGYKKAAVEDRVNGEVEPVADASSYMAQYACMLATQKVVTEVREATELVANLGHAVRQRASELLLEGPMLSLNGSSGGFDAGEDEVREEIERARMHAYSTVSDRCARGIVGYEGWGWRSDGSEAEGCPVTVLEIGPERLEEVQSSDKQPFSAHLVRILNHAQMDKSISGRPDMVQYYGSVDVDVQGREEGGGGGGLKSRARAAHVVSTSLEDFTPLSDVVSAKGGIGGNTSGVRLARFIGREVLRTLSRIHGSNFLLRDLNLKSIYLPPPASKKSNIVLGNYLHMGVLDESGKLSKALAVRGEEGERRVEFCDLRSGGGGAARDEVGQPATKSWDTWCFGTMLFELVTGKKIPSYGSSLVSYLGNVEKIGGGEDSDKLLKRFHFDWIRTIGESKEAGRAGLVLASSVLDAATNGDGEGEEIDIEGSSLLASAALLASIGGGFSYRALLPRSAQLAKSGGGKDAVLEAIRQKWIRLEMKAEGHDVGCCSWPELVEKMSRHARDIERAIGVDGGKEGVGRGLKVMRGIDVAASGGLAPSVFIENLIGGDGFSGNGLAYPLSPVEAARLANCATVKVDGEPLVAYEAFAGIFSGYPHGGKFGGLEDPSSLLLDVLALCFVGDADVRPEPEKLLSHPFFTLSEKEEEAAINDCKAYASGASPVNVMVVQGVVEPLKQLAVQSAKSAAYQQKLDLGVSVGVLGGSGEEEAGGIMFDVGSFCDVLNCANRFLHGGGEGGGAKEGGGDRVVESGKWSPSERHHAAELMFGDELICGGILPHVVACTLRFVSSDQGNITGYNFRNASAVGGSASATLAQRLMNRIARFFESILLETRPIVEGGSSVKDGPASPFVGKVLESLVKLYLGEEGGLASIYGRGEGLKIDFAGLGGSNLVYGDVPEKDFDDDRSWGPFGRDSNSVCHWSSTFMSMIEPVLLLAITESGGGNHLYSPICDWIAGSKGKIESGGEDTGQGGEDLVDDDLEEGVGAEASVQKKSLPFLRTSNYYGELFSLGRTLANLSAASRGQGRTGARARRSCVSYVLTMVRLWGLREGGDGGVEGLSARPDALSSMQRAQLLLDVRIAGKLLPYIADYDGEVRRDVLTAAAAALSTGLSLLGGGGNKLPNPHSELALEFCTEGWCQALAKVLNSGGGGKDDEACRVLAGQCLERMAGAGDIACEAWGAAGVIGSLGIALADNRRAGSKEGALSVFESLAGSSAPNLSKLLQVYPSISGSLSSIGVSLPPPLTLPMLSQRGLDLAKGHTMAEVQQLVVMVRSLVGTAAQMDDNLVLGDTRPPESLIKLVGQIWGWFEVYWLKAVVAHGVGGKDTMEGARANVLSECIDLFEFLVSGGGGDRGAWLLDVAPDGEVCRAGGMKVGDDDEEGGIDEEAESKRRGMDLTKKLLMDVGLGLEDAGLEDGEDVGDGKRVSGSGLTAMVTKMGKNRGGGNVGFEPYRADRLVDLKTKIMHAVASGMKMGGAVVCEKLLYAGVALYFGEAMHAGCVLVKNSVETGSEHIHLATSYAAACAARFRMWESLLVSRSGKCAEQILLSGVCELIVGIMLRDEKSVDVTNVVIDLGFAPFNGKRLCRNEAIDMMVCCKRGAGDDGVTVVSKAVVGEIIRQARKYDAVAQERESLWRMGGGGKGLKAKQARSEVIRVMRSLLALRSGEIVRDLQFVGGVKTELLEREVALWSGGGLSMSAKKSLAAEWVKWAKGQAEQYDDVRYIADEDENALFRYDEELRELLGRGGRERKGGEIGGAALGDGAKEALTRGVMESMAVTVGGGEIKVVDGVEKPEAVVRGVSAPAATTPAVVGAPAPTASQQREVVQVEAAPARRLATLKMAGPPEMLSLQRLLNSIAADVGCDDNQISALSVRRGVQKGGRGEASVVELSVNEGVATAIHARARAGEFLRDAGDGLRFVSVEVQSLGRIDGSGNEVFGAIDDDMDFGSGAGGRGNNMSMSGGVSNFVDEPPMKTYVDNLRVSRGSGGWVGGGSGVEAGTQYSARSGRSGGGAMSSSRRQVDEEEAAASLPVLLDRLGSAMAEVRMVFDGRSSGGEDGDMQRGDALNGLLDLRIDPVLARETLRKNGGLDRYSFADFVVVHARASGYDGSGDEGGNGKVNLPGELWCENGNGGLWMCLGGRDVGKLRRGFEMFAKRGGVDGDMVVEGKSKIGDALRSVGGLEVGKVQLDKYLSGRGAVLGGERLGFQEFCRCWLEFGGIKGGDWAVGGGGGAGMERERGFEGRGEEGERDMYDEYDPDLKKDLGGLEGLMDEVEEIGWGDEDEEDGKGGGERFAGLGGAKRFGTGELRPEARKTPGFSSGGGARWASKMQEKSKVKFKGGERNLVGLGRGDEEGVDGGLRGELKKRALKKGFMELSGGRDTITISSLRVAMAKKGGRPGEDDDLEMKRFIESRGGSLREGLTFSQFQKAYEEGRGSVTGGSLSLPFVDGGGSGGDMVPETAKKVKGKDKKSRRKKVNSDSESEEDSEEEEESRRGGRRGKREEIDEEFEDMVVDEFTEDAIMKTFMMYDLNGDGVISYLELKMTFQQQGRDSSDYEIRAWIRSRDSSGTGSVNFVDFRRAYLAKLRKRTKA